MTMMIGDCLCDSHYQDQKYGKGRRAFNRAKPKDKEPTWRCTVCGRERGTSAGDKIKP